MKIALTKQKLFTYVIYGFSAIGAIYSIKLLWLIGFLDSQPWGNEALDFIMSTDGINKLGAILNIFSSLATIIAAWAACKALNSWRNQLKSSNIYKLATDYESALLDYLVNISDGKPLSDRGEIERVSIGEGGLKINKLHLALKLRGFHVEKLSSVHHAYSETVDANKKNLEIERDKINLFLLKLNDLTKTINNEFR